VIVGDYYREKDIVIVEGLRAGDKVVVEGMLKVVPGQPVQIAQADSAAAQPAATGAQTGSKPAGAADQAPAKPADAAK
jgi:hypothetical protein